MKRWKYVKLSVCGGRLPGLSSPVLCQECWVATAAGTLVNIALCSSLLHTSNQSLKGTQHCPEFSHPSGRPLLASTDKSSGMSQSWGWCVYLKNSVFLWTPTADPPFQQNTLIKLCCTQGNQLFKIQWKWGHWKLIILMLTALWAFACYWNDFTKRNSNEGWIGGEDKLFPSHFPNDRPAAM